MESLEKSLIGSKVSKKDNPCKKVWDEYTAGLISKDELLDAVYTLAVQTQLSNYHCRAKINIPEELFQARLTFQEKIKEEKDSDRSALEAAFYKKYYPKYREYYDSSEALEFKNKSDFFFLCEMYDFFETKNPPYASKVNELIFEYLEDGYKRPKVYE